MDVSGRQGLEEPVHILPLAKVPQQRDEPGLRSGNPLIPNNPPKNTFFSFYPQFLIFQEGEKRSLAQSLPPTHSPITSNPNSGQIPEHDHLDTLSNEVVQTSSLSILSLFNDKVLGAEMYSSQFLEKEEVGHLYYIFAWAQRVFKVATLQEDFIVTIHFLSQRSSWYWSKINHFDRSLSGGGPDHVASEELERPHHCWIGSQEILEMISKSSISIYLYNLSIKLYHQHHQPRRTANSPVVKSVDFCGQWRPTEMNLTGELDDNDYDDEFDDKGALRLILMFVPPLHYGSNHSIRDQKKIFLSNIFQKWAKKMSGAAVKDEEANQILFFKRLENNFAHKRRLLGPSIFPGTKEKLLNFSFSEYIPNCI